MQALEISVIQVVPLPCHPSVRMWDTTEMVCRQLTVGNSWSPVTIVFNGYEYNGGETLLGIFIGTP